MKVEEIMLMTFAEWWYAQPLGKPDSTQHDYLTCWHAAQLAMRERCIDKLATMGADQRRFMDYCADGLRALQPE